MQLPLADQSGKQGVRNRLLRIFKQLLPQLCRFHTCVKGILLMVFPQQAPAGFPPGEGCFAQLRMTEELAVKCGDRFVVRFYSPLETIGGGIVLGLEACRQHFRHISRRQGAFDQGAGDNGAEALHGEYPVNGQPERDPQVFLRCLPHELPQVLPMAPKQVLWMCRDTKSLSKTCWPERVALILPCW